MSIDQSEQYSSQAYVQFFTDNSWVHVAFAFLVWLYWIFWAKTILEHPDFKDLNDARSQESVLVACGWIVVLSLVYSLQVGVISALG